MVQRGKYVSGIIAVFLVLVLTSSVLAQGFSISPAEVEISDLAPGQETELDLIIRNKEGNRQTFILATYNPQESQLRQGRAELPDDSWISFPHQVEVEANSSIPVKIEVAIPSKAKWADKDWEIWLGITPESSDFLAARLYVRLLVSTAEDIFSSYQIGRAIGIGFALALAVLGIYFFRHRKKSTK